jgi:CDP-diacylglycerol--glycerol-3-phosphate 3-phosphatidyltransferase
MEKSIFRTVGLYSLIQLVIVVLFCLASTVPLRFIFAYSAITVFFHIGLYFFLMHFRANFYNQSTNMPLDKINLANRITLLRISSLPAVTFLLTTSEIHGIKVILPVLLALVFLTDTFDGQIARRKKQITKIGAMLDSISDYSLLAVISIVYYINNIVPRWFFFLIFLRLFLQTLGMFIFILLKKPVSTTSTWGGKITIASTMTLYVIELIRLYTSQTFDPVFKIVEYLCGLVIFVLFFEKAGIFFRQGKALKDDRKE